MLLAAARYLAETRRFAGTVHFIFQPAEENEGGGRVMVEEGLFDRFPVDAVFGLHNWPGMPIGEFAVANGPAMAAFDVFEIAVKGRGTHAAMPHGGIDPIVVGSQIVSTLQTIASRETDPLDQIVVSVTQFHAGDTWNVIPERALLRGTVRTFQETTRARAEKSVNRIATGIAAAQGAQAEVRYERRYPATVNTPQETEWAAGAAIDVVGKEHVAQTRRAAWDRKISRTCSRFVPGAISGRATAPQKTVGFSTARITISTTICSRSAPAIGSGSSRDCCR